MSIFVFLLICGSNRIDYLIFDDIFFFFCLQQRVQSIYNWIHAWWFVRYYSIISIGNILFFSFILGLQYFFKYTGRQSTTFAGISCSIWSFYPMKRKNSYNVTFSLCFHLPWTMYAILWFESVNPFGLQCIYSITLCVNNYQLVIGFGISFQHLISSIFNMIFFQFCIVAVYWLWLHGHG